jgi:tRNA A-37 threonylcarbamoyl transferase component Bud32/tetratricopeptide (TPR) repeat protein
LTWREAASDACSRDASAESRVTDLSALSSVLLGSRYALESPLAEGSFCNVYRALDTHSGRHVAVKVLKRVPAADETARRAARFQREAELCASVRHPAVVEVLDSGTTEAGDPFAVFSLLEGCTLRARLDESGALARDRAVRIMAEVLDALTAVHAQRVVHRDLKPENIVLTGPDERAVLIDFGSAASLDDEHDILAGTPQYVAPELLRGERASAQSDLYSWGLVLRECLTGRGTIGRSTASESACHQIDENDAAIPPEAFAAGVSQALAWALAKRADQRPESAQALLRAVTLSSPLLAPVVARTAARGAEERRAVTVLSCRAQAMAQDDASTTPDELAACREYFARRGGLPIGGGSDRANLVFGLHDGPAPCIDTLVATALDWVERDPRSSIRWQIGMHAGEARVDSELPAARRLSIVAGLGDIADRLGRSAPGARVAVSAELASALTNWPLARTPQSDELPAGFFLVRRRHAASTASAPQASRGPFLGRPEEMRVLADAWRSVAGGRTASVLLKGEAGIGKSRLLDELRPISGGNWIEARGTLEGQARPFHLLSRLVSALGGSSSNLATRFALPPDESVPILATLLGEPLPAGYELPLVTPDRFKELTFQTATRLFVNAAKEEPAVVALDDLHWADTATVEFVTVLLEECERAAAPLLLLLSARPEFAPPWPNERVPLLEIASLDPAHVEHMVRDGTGEDQLSTTTVERLLRACRGNPLLVEEAVALLRHFASAARDGSGTASQMPESMDGLLAARFRHLSRDVLATAQIAAALGREFRSDIVAAIASKPSALVAHALSALADSGLVTAHGPGPTVHRFRHDLLRDAAYASIPEADRPRLHRRIATTLRDQFAEVAMQQPAELALHFERGGLGMTAAEYWHQAGTVAMASALYLDGLRHFERGLALVLDEQDSTQRTQHELALTTAVATAHLSTEGFGVASTRGAFAKARALCTTLGHEAPLEILGGVFGAALANSDNEETAAIVPMFEALSMRTDQPMHAFAGHQVLGVHACWSGHHELARVHTAACMELYRRSSVRGISWEYGFGLYCYGYGMSALFHRGLVTQAEAVQQEMLALAESSHHPYCMALALGFATTLTGDLRRPEQTMEHATRLLGIASEQHLHLWTAFAMCAQGQALVQLGRADDGITPIRMGIALLETLGFKCSHGYYLMYLVEALLALGELDEALAIADQGLAFYASHWTRFAEPEMIRLRGVVLENRGDLDAAETHFERALAVALGDGSNAYASRAAMSLEALRSR